MRSFLVVEDTPSMLRWLMVGLRRVLPGARPVGVTNRQDALLQIELEQPDLVVLDLAIPETHNGGEARPETGLNILDSVAALEHKPRVIIVSSYDLREEALRRGADAFIAKRPSTLWPELQAELAAIHTWRS